LRWLERTPDKGEVGGSSPPRPTRIAWLVVASKLTSRGHSSAGRAPALHAGGRRVQKQAFQLCDSIKTHTVDALAVRGDERRGSLR
ncbi:unnamed protein product, partial [Ectocarpus fasciculatus]